MAERFIRTPLGPLRLEEDSGALAALEPVDRLPEGKAFGGASTELLLHTEKTLLAYLAGETSDLARLPVLLPEAPFARAVLEAMRAIPRGETRTYAEVARLVGHEGAARAVGSVCAKNRLLFVLPCHRIVPTQGVGHYRLGSDVKRRLLALEKGDADAFRPRTVFVTSDEARAHLARLGANWARLVEATGPLSRPIIPDLFEGLVRSFTSQQISVKAAAAIMGRFAKTAGRLRPNTFFPWTLSFCAPRVSPPTRRSGSAGPRSALRTGSSTRAFFTASKTKKSSKSSSPSTASDGGRPK